MYLTQIHSFVTKTGIAEEEEEEEIEWQKQQQKQISVNSL